jgi:Fe-S cluster biogenesis protein NfuA
MNEGQNETTKSEATLEERVSNALREVRRILHMEGGDVELVGIDEVNGVVQVRLKGACSVCPFAQLTLQMLIESHVKERAPEVRQVVTVD